MLDRLYAALWRLGARFGAPTAVQQAVFTRIYERNVWGNAESRSGAGSTKARGADITEGLIEVFRRYSISTLLDAPCGDFNWMRAATGPLRWYVGVDVVDELIARNVAQHADGKHRFLCRDMTREPLPGADAILCRDALVHLSFLDIRRALANFKRSGATWLLATTFADTPRNVDCRTGEWRPLNLQIEPFHFPAPVAVIHDVPGGKARHTPDKRLGLWRLEDVPSS